MQCPYDKAQRTYTTIISNIIAFTARRRAIVTCRYQLWAGPDKGLVFFGTLFSMTFLLRLGSAEWRSCTRHIERRPCYRCFSCGDWYCEQCNFVQSCLDCGGIFCRACRPCPLCTVNRAENKEFRDHPSSVRCECGRFLDLASRGCEGCSRLGCIGESLEYDCPRRVLSNRCCEREMCWDCSWWRLIPPIDVGDKHRICCTCPVPSNAVLQREFLFDSE